MSLVMTLHCKPNGFLFWAALLLILPLYCVSIKWLALHRVQPAWTNSGDCPRSREERRVFGLIAYQARVCVRLPELIPHIINAASLTVDACQSAFADRRWNCSSILTAPNLSAELNSGTKEQAFVYALSSAAITHQVAKACSSGLANCPCGFGDTVTTTASIDPAASSLFQRNLTELSYKWKGCSDNVVHGRRISREWSDSRWRPNPAEAVNEIAARNRWNIVDTETNGGSDDYIEDDQIRRILKLKRHSPSKRNGQKARMNEFNNEIGRQVVDQSLYKKCKCHGVSSSCDVKTCWYTLPPIEHVVSILKKKYDNARPMLGSTTLGAMRKRWKHPESDDEQSLVYLKNSPNYCEENAAAGSQG
ncbi:hypothetical protein ACQ4LE_009212 [Meloidogyne hapla]